MPCQTLLRGAMGATFVLAFLPAVASAHVTRYVTPAATATSGACTAAMPCKVGYAVNGASPGDEVVIAPGSYTVKSALTPTGIDVHGVAGQAAPLLTGPDLLSGPFVLLDGGTLRHLSLRGTTAGQDTLVMETGLAEDLEIVSVAGDGAKVRTSPTTTVLRDSVASSAASRARWPACRRSPGSSQSGSAARPRRRTSPPAAR